MDLKEYRLRGKEMVDYIADYLGSIRTRRVFPDVKPGYMRNLIPTEAPATGEDWDSIFSDVERVIMPGHYWMEIEVKTDLEAISEMTHWQSPYMHAYFPALNSPPSLLGDMLADAINCLGFTWASSPACTELETIVMDWLGKMIGLPAKFLHSNTQTSGGGVIQTTASEATFVCLLAARTEAIKRVKAIHPELDPSDINGRLVCYCSDQAHSSVEKASLVGLVKLRLLPSDDELSLRGEVLQDQVDRDRREGLIPFFLCATIGTTGACSFDNLLELGPICAEEDIWMHIDAAYAGSAFVCPEFRPLMVGVEHAQSFAFNPSKWLMVHFDCTAMWVQNSGALHRTFNVQPLYLKHENTGCAIDYMHWQVPLSRRFRSLKLWFVLRSYGVKGLQEHLREGVRLATMFEGLLLKDRHFEIPAKRHLGMVVFRLKGENDLTELLLTRLNKSGKLHCVPAAIKGKYIIRFTVTSTHTTEEDIRRDWYLIQVLARRVLIDMGKEEESAAQEGLEEFVPEEISAVISNIGQQRREGMKRKDYGLSLILSNVPMSPKFINGSFAAMFDNADNIAEYARHLSRRSIDFNGQPIRLSPRKRLKEQSKQYSFDLSQRRAEPPALMGANSTANSRRHQPQRQASLDSKIEEIFENSMEDQQRPASDHKGTNGQSTPQHHQRRSVGSKREKKETGECDDNREKAEEDEEEEEIEDEGEEDADGVVTVTLFESAKKTRHRVVQLVDKAVQSPTSPPPYQPLEAAGSRSNSPSDTVLVTLERSPSTINGLTPLICKHCGHGVED